MSPGQLHWPTHAYVPGQTERHPEDAFDRIRATAKLGASAENLAKSEAFSHGLHYLEAGYFWEAHEVLEPVWMALPVGSSERRFVQGLIQLANGHLKEKMGRPKAALRLCNVAQELFSGSESKWIMGLERSEVLRRLDSLKAKTGLCNKIHTSER